MKILRFFAVVIFAGLVFVGGFGYGRWYSTKPTGAKTEHRVMYYVDPMHTWYKSDKPGIAPDCGMKLEPVYADGGGEQPNTEPKPDNAIQVPDQQQHLAGVRYGTAEWSEGGDSIRVSGRVMPDETRATRVQARTDGWITDVSTDFVGKFVTKGQQMLTLYSPELLNAQQEYLLALKAKSVMQHSSMQESVVNSEALAEAGRRRLLLLNLTEGQIAEIERTQKPVQSVVFYAPASGYVTARNAFPGQRVTPETELFSLLDLNGVWVVADVFEADAQKVRVGQEARIAIPGSKESLFSRVTFIQPQVDQATRTVKVRLELLNPKMQLRPDMWVDVTVNLGGGRRLTVPAEAVIDAGNAKTIFVDRGNGYFEPRAVETGARLADRVEILGGLKAGERIATSGTFLLNSESQMRKAEHD